MFERQTSGSISCPGCGQWVSVNDPKCPHCGYFQPGLWGFFRQVRALDGDAFTSGVIKTCIFLYIASLLLDLSGISFAGGFNILSPSSKSLFVMGASGAYPLFRNDAWWSLFTAPYLHGGIFHIAFNLLWVRDLAPAVGRIYGFAKLVIIYTIAGLVGNLLTSWAGANLTGFLHGSQLTIGASSSVFGLFGALVSYGQKSGSNIVTQTAWQYAIVGFLFGLLMPGVDNWAHFGGFLGGYLCTRFGWLSYKQREGFLHLLLAFACILMVIIGFGLSLSQNLRF